MTLGTWLGMILGSLLDPGLFMVMLVVVFLTRQAWIVFAVAFALCLLAGLYMASADPQYWSNRFLIDLIATPIRAGLLYSVRYFWSKPKVAGGKSTHHGG
jgi:general stress protein CsbA